MKKLLVLLIVLSFVACASTGPSKESVSNNIETDAGTIWKSSYSEGSVRIDKSFKYVGTADKSAKNVRRNYYVYDRGDGFSIYIIDLKVTSGWTFKKDYDPTLGRAQDPNARGLLIHEPMTHSAWDDISGNAYKIFNSLGVDIPECMVVVQQGKVDKSRKSVFFVIMINPSSCDHPMIDIQDALSEYYVDVIVQ